MIKERTLTLMALIFLSFAGIEILAHHNFLILGKLKDEENDCPRFRNKIFMIKILIKAWHRVSRVKGFL